MTWSPTPEILAKFDTLIRERQSKSVRELHDPRIALRVSKEAALPISELKTLIAYNPETGDLSWLPRPTDTVIGRPRTKGPISGKMGGYIYVSINGKGYLGHRLAWAITRGYWPTEQIDHIDRVRDNNRWSNLREASNRENHTNRTDNASGQVGVMFEKSRGRWKAFVRVGYTMHNIGRFHTVEEATAARAAYMERLQCLGF